MDWFVEEIETIDCLENYQAMYEQPLLLEEPKLDDAIAFVRSIVK
jgi:hypothetical protein